MNKQDLIAEVSARLDISKRAATDAVDAVLSTIRRAVARGEKVSLPGFGSFETKLRAPRNARNPQTGAAVNVPATAVPTFRPGKALRAAVAGGRTKNRGTSKRA